MTSRLLFFINGLICALRILLYPLINYVLPLFSPWVKKRLEFERRNAHDLYSRSFRFDGKRADVTFEVSSEGELEQVRPLIDQLLEEKFLIEIIYASESVEKKCELLAQEHRGRVRVFRLPLLSFKGFNFFLWRTGRVLILCRYDFYPELMLLGARREVFFVLLSATLKNKEKTFSKFFHPVAFYLRQVYAHFDIIIAASRDDEKRFLSIGYPSSNLRAFDFRVLQILKRLSLKDQKWAKIPSFILFEECLKKVPYGKRILFGSCWPNEMEVFQNPEFLERISRGELFVCLAPHKLSDDSIALITKTVLKHAEILRFNIPIYEWGPKNTLDEARKIFEDFSKKPGLIIVRHPGILCELYQSFGHAFVGGGHGRSIHSVLEPYVAGATVYCGPKIHRSTEFDLAKENTPAQMQIIENLSFFHNVFSRFESVDKEMLKREEMFSHFKKQWNEIYSLILLKLGKKHDFS